MLVYNDKQYRNLEEQVLQNHNDIMYLLNEGGTLNQFGIKVVGHVNSEVELPDPSTYKGEYGDAYTVGLRAPYKFFIFTREISGTSTGDYWFNIGEFPLAGPEGPEGPEGPKGDTGVRGSTWTSKSGAPTSTAHIANDQALDTSTGDVYQFNGTSWTKTGNIQGPQGIQGIQGPVGPEGGQGPIGPVGPKGENGQSFSIVNVIDNINQLPTPTKENQAEAYLVGTEVPYDLYVVVGPSASGAYEWLNVGPMEGIKGEPGPQGPAGPAGPQGPEGEVNYDLVYNKDQVNNLISNRMKYEIVNSLPTTGANDTIYILKESVI